MSFMGVGPLELAVILVVALLIVGPERLPRLAADIAKTIREIRQYTGRFAAEFTEVVQEFEREAEQEKATWKEVSEGLSGVSDSATKAVEDVRTQAASVPAAATGQRAPGTPPAPNGAPPVQNGAAGWVDVPEPDSGTSTPADPAPARREPA